MSRWAYTVMFVDDDGFMRHTIPQTYRATRKQATEIVRELRNRDRDVRIRVLFHCGWESGNHVVWAAVDEQRRYHAQQCSGVAA